MKKILLILTLALASAMVSAPSYANWFGNGNNGFSGNNGEWKMGPNGPYWDDSGWPVWTPMYWMDEFMGEWDNNGWSNNGYSNYSTYNTPYGAAPAPYSLGLPNTGYTPNYNYGYPAVAPVPAFR